MKFFVESAGILAAGLAGWREARAVLAGQSSWVAGELVLPKLDLLPPVERRRTGLPVKLAIAVGQDALTCAAHSADGVATVFTASGGDGEVINEICSTLAGPDRQISPTRFHNSVHNAPAGYWAIATGSHAPSTSLCGLDWSFAVGLVEAAAQIAVDHDCVLLIAYDLPYPEPLLSARRILRPFGTALLLTRDRSGRSIAGVELAVSRARKAATRMHDPLLEQLRSDNPAARALPLLAALAKPEKANLCLDYVAGNSLAIAVSPC